MGAALIAVLPLRQLAALIPNRRFEEIPGVGHNLWATHPRVWVDPSQGLAARISTPPGERNALFQCRLPISRFDRCGGRCQPCRK